MSTNRWILKHVSQCKVTGELKELLAGCAAGEMFRFAFLAGHEPCFKCQTEVQADSQSLSYISRPDRKYSNVLAKLLNFCWSFVLLSDLQKDVGDLDKEVKAALTESEMRWGDVIFGQP